MTIQLDSVYERDMDFLFMRKLANDKKFVRKFFLESEEMSENGYHESDFVVEKVAHSVMTEDGESDIEAVLSMESKKVALLIEDKIDAIAMPEQSSRYYIRGQKAIDRGDYDEFFVFIVAPENYLKSNSEAKKYKNRISYEDILKSTDDEYEKSVIRYALSDANIVRLPRSAVVTAFWDKIYDYLDENYRNEFRVHGYRGLERSGQAGQWISMSCAKPYSLQIKSDRGYVDLEISGYADKFSQFSKDNMSLIEENKLYLRCATKSLAIRKYIHTIDFTQPFDTQVPYLKEAFDAAKELKNLITILKIK